MKVQNKKPTPTVVIACIVRHKGKILLIKRKKPPYAGLLSMPGGKVEFGEHPIAAALRETKEETGLEGRFEKMLGVFSEVLEAPQRDHFIIFVCLLTAPSFEVNNSSEGELVWIEENNWNSVKSDLIPSDWRIVK
ncbi:NUDIX hydrolase, partial [Candidatus Micrarchaeota archaeon]|nr:NUDIX hydrolase [Candidatus Micrarchaeota archaeon]